MATFFEKVDTAKPAGEVPRDQRAVIRWERESSGPWEGHWYGWSYDDQVVATLRPANAHQFAAHYMGYGGLLELPTLATLDTAKAWAQARHSEALAAQVEKLLEQGEV